MQALEWKDKEHVFFTNLITHFGLTYRESATKSFEDLLQSSRISSKRREFLNAEFNKFQKHYEEQFWTKQRLACAAQDAVVKEAESAYAERRITVASASS
ncbi:hypothetical protein BGZ54_001944 [Gamsiella multidivaricata]|nr:hypothetical protein BGZ54_001944 [Gamsiella multidivaricata]